jgi:hypothetical protein
MYANSFQQGASPSSIVHFRVQIQLQQRPQVLSQPQQPSPQPQSKAQLPPKDPQPEQQHPQESPQQPQLQQSHIPPLRQPHQIMQPQSEQHQQAPEQVSIAQIIQLLQLVQQLRSPAQSQPPCPQMWVNQQRSPARQLYQRRFHPYNSQSTQTSAVVPDTPTSDSHAPTSDSHAPTPLSPPTHCGDDEARVRSTTKRTDYTHEFKERFTKILQNCDEAQNAWRTFRGARKCTVARGPCIKAYREFCDEYGGELQALANEDKYEKLGTITKCGCVSDWYSPSSF